MIPPLSSAARRAPHPRRPSIPYSAQGADEGAALLPARPSEPEVHADPRARPGPSEAIPHSGEAETVSLDGPGRAVDVGPTTMIPAEAALPVSWAPGVVSE